MRIAWSTDRPWDLWGVAALVGLAVLSIALDAPGWLRVPLGLLAVLVAPGYAFVAALLPERHVAAFPVESATGDPAAKREGPHETERDAHEGPRRGLEPLERAALSLGLSIAIVPLLGLALNFTPFGIRLWPVTATLALFTLAALAAAWWRRSRLPADERFELVVRLEAPAWSSQTPLDKALTAGLMVAVLVAAATLAYVLAVPRPGEAFTEFYQLGPTGKAACYPASYREGVYRPSPSQDCPSRVDNITLGIVNHEGRDMTYWLRILWTLEEAGPANSTVVQEIHLVEESSITLADQPVRSTARDGFQPQYSLDFPLPPPPTNGTLRLSFQLYLEPPPPVTLDPAALDAPYRRLHLWIEADGVLPE